MCVNRAGRQGKTGRLIPRGLTDGEIHRSNNELREVSRSRSRQSHEMGVANRALRILCAEKGECGKLDFR